MELRHLRYFVAVAEEFSFTKAAARLRLAQPSLTRQIKNLERELGVQLFTRGQRRIALTEQGRFFLDRSQRLLAQASHDVQEVRRRGASGGRALNVGYTADLHCHLLPHALAILRQIWPGAALNLFDLTVAEQLRALAQNKLDLAFAREVKLPPQASLGRAFVQDCEVMAVLPESDPAADNGAVRLAALRSSPFIVLAEESFPGARAWLLGVCKRAGFVPQIAHAVDRTPTLLNCVGLGLGVALLPQARQHPGCAFRPLAEAIRSRTEIVWKDPVFAKPLQQFARSVGERLAQEGANRAGHPAALEEVL